MNDVEVPRRKLGLPAAPLELSGLSTACEFFRTTLREDPTRWWQYFRGIDFHKHVEVALLPSGTLVSRHQQRARPGASPASLKPFIFFTVPGTSPTSTGTTFADVEFQRYTTDRVTRALVSRASTLSFLDDDTKKFDRVSRFGGCKQFIIAARDAPRAL